jgi:hypothetical protein
LDGPLEAKKEGIQPHQRCPVNGDLKQAAPLADHEGSLLVLSLLALVVSAVLGMVGAIFRVLLGQADRLRDLLIAWAHGTRGRCDGRGARSSG